MDTIFGATFEEFSDCLSQNPNLRGAIQGYMAEVALKKHLEQIPGVTSVEKISDHDRSVRGDFKVTMESGKSWSIECKTAFDGYVRLYSTTYRPMKHLARTRLIPNDYWDVLCFADFDPNTQSWFFRFLPFHQVPSHRIPGFHKDVIKEEDVHLHDDITSCFNAIIKSGLTRGEPLCMNVTSTQTI